jgi:hypothetical protein
VVRRWAASAATHHEHAPGGRETGDPMGSVIKKRRKKMRKHKHKKMLKKTRWQRRG